MLYYENGRWVQPETIDNGTITPSPSHTSQHSHQPHIAAHHTITNHLGDPVSLLSRPLLELKRLTLRPPVSAQLLSHVMSTSRPIMSAYRSATGKHSSDGNGEDNSGHLLGLNYPKEKKLVDHNSDPSYILVSLASLPAFPSSQPSQPSSTSAPSTSSTRPSLVPLPVTLTPPLRAAIPDACPELLFSLLSSASTHLLSSNLAAARAALDDAALLLASPQVWDGLTRENWKELVAEDRRKRDEWDEYERRSIAAVDMKEAQRPTKLQLADGDTVPSIAEEDGGGKEEGEKEAEADTAGTADSSAAVLSSAASAIPSQPSDIPSLSPITQLIFNMYFPLRYAQLAQAEGKHQNALLLHWKAWLAHEQYVSEQERGREEERRRGEEAQRRARGVSAAEDDDDNDSNSAKGASASSTTPTIHCHIMRPFTFPSPLSATVLYCLGLSALHLRSWQAGLRAFGVAFRVQCATIERSTREFVDVASTMHNIALCLGWAGDDSNGGWTAAWQWMKAAEELMVARLPATHPRLLQLRANLTAITPLRASLQPDNMRSMMDGMSEAKRQKDAEAELLKAAKAKKGAKKGTADQPTQLPTASSSSAATTAASGKKSEWPIIEGFGADGNWFQQPRVEESKEAVAAATSGEGVVGQKEQQVWLRRWTVEMTPYEKMLMDGRKAAGGAADGKKAKAGKGAKKGKAK